MKVEFWKQELPQSVALLNLSAFHSANLTVKSPIAIDFIEVLSQRLFSVPRAKDQSELVALGFWLRKKHIESMLKGLQGFRKPVGLVVHYTPANVDTMFVYSWVCSLLLGNRNIVKLPSQLGPLQKVLLSIVLDLLRTEKFQVIQQTNHFITYDHTTEEGVPLSLAADARVIWGGDDSVKKIRALVSQPRCRDIAFSDRKSFALINGDSLNLLNKQELLAVAEKLWKDIKPYTQQACSSPKLLFWLGSNLHQDYFFEQLKNCSAGDDSWLGLRNEQLVAAQQGVAEGQFNHVKQCGLLTILTLADGKWVKDCSNTGFWVLPMLNIKQLTDMTTYLTSKIQTLSYWGIDKSLLVKLLEDPSITGVDRIAPFGEALKFAPQWDGYDLLNQLSREVVIT